MNKTKHFKRTAFPLSAKSMVSTLLLLIAMLVPQGAWAIDFISEIKYAVHDKQETAYGYLSGYEPIKKELNNNPNKSGERWVYIGYKTDTDPSKAITDIMVVSGESYQSGHLETDNGGNNYVTFANDTRKWYRCPSQGQDGSADLNAKNGGDYLALYYTRDGNTTDGKSAITSLDVAYETGLSGWTYAKLFKNSSITANGNTNEGTNGTPTYIVYKSHTHAYTAAFSWATDGKSCTATVSCSCGDTHSNLACTVTSEPKSGSAATCTVKGWTTYTAKVTSNGKDFSATKDVQDIAALGHSYTSQTATDTYLKSAANCTADAVYYHKCSRCDSKGSTTWTNTGTALGHSLTATPAKAATCTEAGNNAYWTCSTCKKVFSNSTATTETTVDAQTIVIPHSYSDGICTACNGYETPAGNGTSSSPYLIGNQGNLLWFADKCTNTNSVRNFHAKQTADIVYTQDSNWRGLGSSAWNYRGTYDGDGHTISGLKCNANYSSARIGMFGIIGSGGKVMNLGLLNVSFSGQSSSYIGAFAYESYGTITNCYATGSISGDYTAGICYDNMATISNCYSAVQLNKYNSASKTYPIANQNAPTNCYSTSSSSPSAQFTSGEVCYKLNGGNTSGIWKQTIGTDQFPVFDKDHATVYSVQNTKCDGVTTYSVYTNNSNQQPTVDAHSLTATPAKAETCTEAGNNAYWTCSTCNKVFSNSNATTETTVAAQTIAALSHDYSQIEDANYLVSPATCTNDAVYHEKCSRCDTKEGPLWGVKGTATGNHDYTSHTLTLVEDGLYAYACDYGCGTHTDDHIIKDFYGEDNHLELTEDGAGNYSTSEDITLADGASFSSPVDFTAASVTYTRTGIKNQWGTLVVPFDVNGSGDDYDLYTLFEMDEYNLTLIKFDGTLPAGTPVIFRLHDDLAGDYSLTLTASNTTVSGQFNEGSEANGLQLVGTYETTELDINDYFISNNQFWRVYDAWAAAWGVKVAPFRAYLKSKWAGAKASALSIRIADEDDDVTAVETLNAITDGTAEYYDMNGRRINSLQKGVNIVKYGNGKTVKVNIK